VKQGMSCISISTGDKSMVSHRHMIGFISTTCIYLGVMGE